MIISQFDKILRSYSLEKDVGYHFKQYLRNYIKSDTRLLDVGCGHRAYGEEYYKLAAWRVGVDQDLEALRQNDLMDRTINSSVEDLTTSQEPFDLIIAQWVFEHLENPKKAVAVMSQLCKTHGHLILMTTNLHSPLIFLSKVMPTTIKKTLKKVFLDVEREDTYKTYYRINTPTKLDQLLSDAKFQKVELITVPVYTYFGFNKYVLILKIFWDKFMNFLGLGKFFRTHIVAVYRKSA